MAVVGGRSGVLQEGGVWPSLLLGKGGTMVVVHMLLLLLLLMWGVMHWMVALQVLIGGHGCLVLGQSQVPVGGTRRHEIHG